MARFISNVCAVYLLVACGRPGSATADAQAPSGASSTTRAAYAISGIVRDTRRQPIRAARIDVIAPGFEGKFVVSDGSGRYRIPDLFGGVHVVASKDGYFSDIRAIAATNDAVVDFILQALHRIEIGNAIREALTSDYPMCFGRDYGDTGLERRGILCHRFFVTASVGGVLEVVLMWDPQTRLALDLIAPDGLSVQSFNGDGRTSLTMPVQKGVTYEVRVLGDREKQGAVQDFELRTTVK